MVINMRKLPRVHYLKHYLGGSALVWDEDYQMTGQIETVDLEDGGVQIKSGQESKWVEGIRVTPSLKKFKDLTDHDIKNIINHCKWNYIPFDLDANDYMIIRENDRIILKHRYLHIGIKHEIVITSTWAIFIRKNSDVQFVDNIGTIIFLLCQLGYDVTGNF